MCLPHSPWAAMLDEGRELLRGGGVDSSKSSGRASLAQGATQAMTRERELDLSREGQLSMREEPREPQREDQGHLAGWGDSASSCALSRPLQAVLQMEQRKQQQQQGHNAAPGPEGQLKFQPQNTGASPGLKEGGEDGPDSWVPGGRGRGV